MTDDDDRLDLGALGPEPTAWRARAARTAAIAAARHAAAVTLAGQIRRAALPAVALAAAAAIALWIVPAPAPTASPVALPLRLLDWAVGDDPASMAESLALAEAP